jgi:membrane protease YdiL (CAAX protease family)
VGLVWYPLVLVGVPLLELLGTFAVLGAVPLDDLGRNWPLIFTRYLPYVLLNTVFIGLAEEPGWRGFALPRLQKRHGPLLGTVILGVVWAAWHLPNLLFGGWTAASYALWLVATLAASVVYAWVYNRTGGSVLLAMLLHAAINTGLGLTTWLVPALGEGADPRLVRYAAVAVAFVAAALVLIVATRGRLGYRPAGVPAETALPHGPYGAGTRA